MEVEWKVKVVHMAPTPEVTVQEMMRGKKTVEMYDDEHGTRVVSKFSVQAAIAEYGYNAWRVHYRENGDE